MPLNPNHQAASDGDLMSINQLLQKDGGRLNALVQGAIVVKVEDGETWKFGIKGCMLLMLAAYRGHDLVVARLLALGADVAVASSNDGFQATHWACLQNRSSALALLLDAGASINIINHVNDTPLGLAAWRGATECVDLLIARGGGALDLDAGEVTALHHAACNGHAHIVQLLLLAGADPTIRENNGETPLQIARADDHLSCIALLEAALAEPQRAHLLLKARTLLDASYSIRKARQDARDEGLPATVQQWAAGAVTPAYLKRRVQQGQQLPHVSVAEQRNNDNEQLVACLKYALGLEGGGGVHDGPEAAPQGMLKEVFVELCEMLVPKWDRKNI